MAEAARPIGWLAAASGSYDRSECMIGPIAATIILVALGLGLSAWSILRRAARGGPRAVEDHHGFEAAGGESSFALGVEGEASVSPQRPG